MENRIEDQHILSQDKIITPNALKKKIPLSQKAIDTVFEGHSVINDILEKKDPRLLVVVGPCSIHDKQSAMDYARRLKGLHDELKDVLYLTMRVYFEKPRTNVGWQGLLNDPHLDGSCLIDEGLFLARKMLLDINEMGLPAAGEALDLITPQYIQDLISWTAIGARTTESQTHRKMASAFTSPVGFKNGTDGSVKVAINAMLSAAHANNFISVNLDGEVAVIRTKGNPYSHIVLRGSSSGPNFDSKHIKSCEQELVNAGLKNNIMVDCSHANSNKQPLEQLKVLANISQQIKKGNSSIMGLMIESHLHEGNQPLPASIADLKYGISITDACLGWEQTEKALRDLHHELKPVLEKRSQN